MPLPYALFPMKVLLILLAVASTISASAADRRSKVSQKPDPLASAVGFARFFYTELNREVTLPQPFNTGGGSDNGNIHDREWDYRIPTKDFSPKQLSDVARCAHKQWNIGWMGVSGCGGNGNRFSAQASAMGATIFIDAIAYNEGEDTVILVLARCAN